jgi:hypothetical protein
VEALLFKDAEDIPLGQLLIIQERFFKQRSLHALNGVRLSDLEEEVRLLLIQLAAESLAGKVRSKMMPRATQKLAGTSILSAIHGTWGSSLGSGKKKLASW